MFVLLLFPFWLLAFMQRKSSNICNKFRRYFVWRFFWRYQCLHNEFKANLKLHLNFCSYGFSRNILILSASNLSSIVSLKCILNMVKIEYNFMETFKFHLVVVCSRVNVQGVKSLGGHFACLCREFDFYEVKKNCYYFSKRKGKYFYAFNYFCSEKSSKRAK